MIWQLLNFQLWYYIWCTYVIGQHRTMWSTCVAIQTKPSLQSHFKHDIKNEIVTWHDIKIQYTSGHSYAVITTSSRCITMIFSPKDTTHRHRLAMHCRSITCYMYIHVFLQPLKLFNLEACIFCWIIRVNKKCFRAYQRALWSNHHRLVNIQNNLNYTCI